MNYSHLPFLKKFLAYTNLPFDNYPAFCGSSYLSSSINWRSYRASILLQIIIWLITSRLLRRSAVLFISVFRFSVNIIVSPHFLISFALIISIAILYYLYMDILSIDNIKKYCIWDFFVIFYFYERSV